ncbi:hypothetical protein CIPAW_16G091900 [Carya illinoinensis]|uniref:Uncharacterized protein n=1 Tax=Carya illinoinensis TaxID=32201 RepID=A0A8T1N7D7_CARIL|nr:hypothetical protein CIPAW_16G091900 [Carya illinoinensis]
MCASFLYPSRVLFVLCFILVYSLSLRRVLSRSSRRRVLAFNSSIWDCASFSGYCL